MKLFTKKKDTNIRALANNREKKRGIVVSVDAMDAMKRQCLLQIFR